MIRSSLEIRKETAFADQIVPRSYSSGIEVRALWSTHSPKVTSRSGNFHVYHLQYVRQRL